MEDAGRVSEYSVFFRVVPWLFMAVGVLVKWHSD
jgi:hypothetical protein